MFSPSPEPSGLAPFTLAVIVGSVREGRYGRRVADWFLGEAEGHDDVKLDLVDLHLAWWAHALRSARSVRPYGS